MSKTTKSTGHNEGTLRKYVLLNYQEKFPFCEMGLKTPYPYHPIGIGIHVPKHGQESGGSIDILFMNKHSNILIAEIKKRENTERGRKPIKQLLRYTNGLKSIASFDTFRKELTKEWLKERRKSYRSIPQPIRSICHVSKRFEKAMKQLFGSQFEYILRKAFKKIGKGDHPAMVVIQNSEFHQKTAEQVRQYRNKGFHIWGLEIPYPENRCQRWRII
ncbi:MAG: hypothetical protein QME51_07925 [Planctomycetota bacterium]|nr:hypothetical protein [Planctomycetota bacterium]